MHGILISKENLPKIWEVEGLSLTDCQTIENISDHNVAWWVFITGYVDSRGGVHEYTWLPEYILQRNHEFDSEKIKTDWDQIVRKSN
jgi:hypothetical protein